MAVVVTAASGFDLGYVWKNQAGHSEPERSAGGYYINAAQAGEPPGRWWGPGAWALGFEEGQVVERGPYEQVYRQVDPRTGAKLGRSRGSYARFNDHLARLKAAEPHATAERVLELEREAAKATRQSPVYTDMTVSFSKSISIFHASIRENERRARLAGDEAETARWAAIEERYQAVLQAANRAGLEYVQRWAGITRTGYHGTRAAGQEAGRFEEAELIVTSWLQGTSRDGDPQDHVHNQVARLVRTTSDGKHRALDTICLRQVLGAVQAVVATHVECGLTTEFGISWVPRQDGASNEIAGVTQEQMDAYSTRTVSITGKLPDAVEAWTVKYGREPNQRELLYIRQEVTLASREGKEKGAIDWDALTAKWDAQLGGELASVAPSVSELRSSMSDASGAPRAGAATHAEPTRAELTHAVQRALTLTQAAHSTWTRADFLKRLAPVLPVQTRTMSPEAAVALLDELADEAIAGSVEQVVCLEAPQWPPLPSYLLRELDGRSVYTRPGTTRYATGVQLSLEEQLLSDAQRQAAPHLSRDRAAALLGADPATLEALLHEQASESHAAQAGSGLRLDQSAVLFHALTSARIVEVITGPAGSGKTRTLAEAARAWVAAGMGDVLGIATAQAARNVLAAAGVEAAENSAIFLGHLPGRRGARGVRDIGPGTLLVLDEASVMSLPDLAEIVAHAARRGAKVLIAGDQEQLAAVESGGGMMLLARTLGFVQLAEAVRFTAAWERDASLRLRTGDVSVLASVAGFAARTRIRRWTTSCAGTSRTRSPGETADDPRPGALQRGVAAHPRRPGPPRPRHRRTGGRAGRRGARVGRRSDHLPAQRPRRPGGGAGAKAGQWRHAADRGDPPGRHDRGPAGGGLRSGDRGTSLGGAAGRLGRVRHGGPGVRGDGAFGARADRPGRAAGGHRDGGPAVAVCGDDARGRVERGDRVHPVGASCRSAGRDPAGA